MPKTEPMTIEEKLLLSNKAIALKKTGDREGYSRIMRSIPMPSYLAKVAKEKIGPDFLINGGWNLAEAEAEFGSDWLSK